MRSNRSRAKEESKDPSNIKSIMSHEDDSNQQGIPDAIQSSKVFDDWDIISDPGLNTRIKNITIYADYYICAFEITYID